MSKTIRRFGPPVLALIAVAAFITYWRIQKPNTEFRHVSYINDARGPASSGHGKHVRPSTLLYKLKENASAQEKQDLENALANFDIQTESKLMNGKIHFSKIRKQKNISEEEIAQALKATGAVEYAEPDTVVNLQWMGNDPYLSNQWHHSKIRSFEAWDMTTGSPSIVVATCDTGVDSTHEDLKANLLPGYNAVDMNNSNLTPNNPHGTMTAGVIAAVSNNQLGGSGVAGQVRILPIRISNTEDGAAYFSTMTNCIEYAANQGAKVVNLSYDGGDSQTVDVAAQHLRAKGGLLVMAAGNSGKDLTGNPDYASFLLVGATDQNDVRPDWSNFGAPVDLVAPGVDILTTTVGGGYVYASGTSFSAPMVAGSAALIFSLNPNFTPAQVEDFILATAKPLGSGSNDSVSGHGRLDVAAALAEAKRSITTPAPSPSPAPTPSPAPLPAPNPAPAPSQTQVLTLANPTLSAPAGQNVTVTTRFQAVPMTKNYQVLVHIVDPKTNKIVLNGDYTPTVPTTKWTGLVTYKKVISIPATLTPGTYSVRVGLYENVYPYTTRVTLATGAGVTADASQRYSVGTLTVRKRR